MAKKFTYEDHKEKMRQILAQPAPVAQDASAARPDVKSSLLERARSRKPTLPKLPKLPKMPRV